MKLERSNWPHVCEAGMGIRLYKRDGQQIRYWEAFSWEGQIAIRTAPVGTAADATMIAWPDSKTLDSAIEFEANQVLRQGFERVRFEAQDELVIQYRVEGFGTEQDLEQRHRVEELIHDELGVIGGGVVDGGDIGSGTANVFCFVIDAQIVVPFVVERLKREQLLDGAVLAVIARQSDGDHEVVWPFNYSGKFNII